MKNYLLFSLASISIFFGNLHASLEEHDSSHWYIGGIAGTNHIDSYTEVGSQLGFFWGYKFSSSIRLEGEMVVRVNKFKGENTFFSTGIFGANILYDLDLRIPIKPYFGVGVGSQHRVLSFLEDGYKVNFAEYAVAYQGIFGASFPLFETALTSLEYRYVANNKGSDVNHSLGLSAKKFF